LRNFFLLGNKKETEIAKKFSRPPVGKIGPATPPRLDETVWRCLAKNPDQRYGCMPTSGFNWKHWRRLGRAPRAHPQSRCKQGSGNSRVPWLVAGIRCADRTDADRWRSLRSPVTKARGGGAVVRSCRLRAQRSLPCCRRPVRPCSHRTERGSRSPHVTTRAKVLLYVRPLASSMAQPLPGTEEATYPFWSPDSREIGFFVPGKLKKINASGGPAQTVCDSISGRGGAWSKAGVIVFTSSSNQPLLSVSAEGGTPVPASKLDVSQAENSHLLAHLPARR